MEYYSLIKGNELLTHGTTWINPKGNTVSEKSQSEKVTYYMVLEFTFSKSYSQNYNVRQMKNSYCQVLGIMGGWEKVMVVTIKQ